ncbi:O-antigen ligase family protein [Thiocapsa imhoffii]|nr:O-antigen ligase family protein [Thiocapsa imhoffii]
MTSIARVWPGRRQLESGLLILFAFAAWNMTGLAHLALFGLLLLLLADLPRAWPRLRVDPLLWVALGALGVIVLLALRAALLLPQTAAEQWSAVWGWWAPFLFLVVAWALRADVRLIHGVLIAAVVGLIVGVLRKSDWSLLEEILGGMRYYFGQSVLGIGFVTSVVLIGLLIYHPALAGPRRLWCQPRRLLSWGLWTFAVLFVIGMLVILQARGAVLVLAAAGGLMVLNRLLRARRTEQDRGTRLVALVAVLFFAFLAALVLWVSWERVMIDIVALTTAAPTDEAAWTASAAIRLNLWRLGLDLFEARPWLGWGPGTRSTDFLVPAQMIPFAATTLEHAPVMSHLHSVIAEMLVRFGLAGVLIALAWLVALGWGARAVWVRIGEQDPRLRELLWLSALMTAVFFFYDFRIMNPDLRFFLILQLGLFHTFWLHATGPRGSTPT